jgi:hypothetical protein
MGQVIESRTINELPLKDGMVVTMATLSPGVIFTPESAGYVRPFDTSSPSTMSIDGTRSGSNQFMMDGAPNMQGTQIAYSPPPGVVEEFKVQAATFDASSGFMGGASINMSLKSGTNRPHGQIYYFMQNPVFTADKFFRLAVGKPQFRLYRWGGNMSGPVVLPKLYNGKNRTFFMYGYEGIWSFDPSPWVVESVPSTAMRGGDFSALLALGSRYQIYDPFSIQPAPNGRTSRQPLPGNIIPANRINPVSANIAKLWDMPNQPGTVDGINNYSKGKERPGHVLESHRTHRPQCFGAPAFLCADELHGPAAPREHPAQQHGRRQLLPLQQRLRRGRRLYHLAAVPHERPLYPDAVHHGEPDLSAGLGPSGAGLLLNLRESDQGRRSAILQVPEHQRERLL